MESLEADFAENRVHHDQKSDGWFRYQRLMTVSRDEIDIPIGRLTPTNCPFCNAGPVEGTRFPNIMPMAMASRIHITRNRSRNDRPFRGGTSPLLRSVSDR